MKLQAYKVQNYIKNIDQEPIAGCLLYGPQESVISYRFNFIAKKIVSDLTDPFLVSNISKERLKEDKAILADEFYSMSMLGGRKLIIVKDSDNSLAQSLKTIFEDDDYHKKSNNFLLIQGGDLNPSNALRKIAETNPNFVAIPCYEDDDKTIKNFISALLKNKNVKFDNDVIGILQEKFGKNRQVIMSEIEKIITYLGDKKELEVKDLEGLVQSQDEISTDQFIASFANQDKEKSINLCEKLFLNNNEPIMLIRYLINYFFKLQSAKILIEREGQEVVEAVKKQRLFFKVENEFRMQLSKFSLEKINAILDGLLKLELKIKQGQVNAKIAFLGFVRGS